MLRFRVDNIVPAGGRYFYEVPETQVYIETLTKTSLLARVHRHYVENGLLVPPDLEARIMDFMCRRLPEGFCYGDLDGRPRAKVITLQQVKTRTVAAAAGNPRVPVGEARRRAVICSGCPKNNRAVCPTCIGLVAWARRLAGNQLGGVDDTLGICEVDGLALPTKVHLSNLPENDEYPDTCWRTE